MHSWVELDIHRGALLLMHPGGTLGGGGGDGDTPSQGQKRFWVEARSLKHWNDDADVVVKYQHLVDMPLDWMVGIA